MLDNREKLFRSTKILLHFIASFWLVFGALWLFRESDYRWFYATGAFSNAIVLTMLTWLMSRGRRWAYWLLVTLLAANVILTVTDQIGWFDLAYLIPAIAALVMVVKVRTISKTPRGHGDLHSEDEK